MKIRIIAVGNIKEKYLQLGIKDYLDKVNFYANTEIVELPAENLSSDPSDFEIENSKIKEGKKILKAIKDNDFVINLDLNKKEMDSIEFAKYLNDSLVKGGSSVTFVIGGSYGLSDEVKKRANDSISLSKMTYLHTMTRLILLEQIYRAFKINKGETYHKWINQNLKNINH